MPQRQELHPDDWEPHRLDRQVWNALDEAAKRGEFDDLPNKGQPLELDGSVFGGDWIVNKILKNANYVPEWAELKKHIDALETQIETLKAAWRAEPTSQRSDSLTAAWELLNALIRKYNAAAPSPTLHRYPMPVARRLELLQQELH